MKNALIRNTLVVASLLMFTTPSQALDATIKTPDAVKSTVEGTKAGTKAALDKTKAGAKTAAADAKAAVKAKTIDINSASETELKAIPGVGDTYASKIIAGRPYLNKTQLKTRNILPAPVYDKVKDLIVAKQAVKKAIPIKK